MLTKLASEYDEVISSERFAAGIAAMPDGMSKEASADSSRIIRRRLRENAFIEAAIPSEVVSEADLAYALDTDYPYVIEEMEPESPGARTVPFGQAAETYLFEGNKFAVYFSEQQTREFVQNIWRLKGYKNDPRKIVTDNALKDLATEDDSRLITTIDEIVGATNSTNATTGFVQHTTSAGGITRSSHVDTLSYLEDRELSNGLFLMNRKTAKGFLKWKRDEVGGDLAEKLVREGSRGFAQFNWFGVNHALTMKRNIVPDGVVYQFVPPNFLGRNYELQPVTMTVKREGDFIRFKAVKKSGFTIANIAGVHRHDFTT